MTDETRGDTSSEGKDDSASSPTARGTAKAAARKQKKRMPKARAKEDPAKRGGGPRPFPAETLQEALRVPTVLKQFNAGNPWTPAEVAKALGVAARGNKIWYLTASARDYGLTLGTRDTDSIELAPAGRELLYAATPEAEREAAWRAFFNVEVFRSVYEYYKGGALPDLKYLQNTLEATFKIPIEYHDDFVRIFTANVQFTERYGGKPQSVAAADRESAPTAHSVIVGEPKSGTDLVAFVIMPFVEKTNGYSKGFFDEVLRNLITPAAVSAGFKVETAKREGSDVIQSTIVNQLLAADLVIADLTEHNPNVLFELGLRMAFEKPTALVRARGTAAIFDVDNLLRVLDYEPHLWKSTLENDVPRITSHIKGTWESRESGRTYMQILKSK
jgi:hypothetical protein